MDVLENNATTLKPSEEEHNIGRTDKTPSTDPNITKKTKYIELYNLSPAVDAFKLRWPVNKTVVSWYVPETYPCWELPLLYGEITKKNSSQVFTTFPLYLRNVIDDQPHIEQGR